LKGLGKVRHEIFPVFVLYFPLYLQQFLSKPATKAIGKRSPELILIFLSVTRLNTICCKSMLPLENFSNLDISQQYTTSYIYAFKNFLTYNCIMGNIFAMVEGVEEKCYFSTKNHTSEIRRHSQVVRQRSAKPPSPGSNPGVAFVNIPLFSALEAPSSFNGSNFNLFHFTPNQVESTHKFRHKFSPSFSYYLEVWKSQLSVCWTIKLGDIFHLKLSLINFGVNYYGY
jgi:hypothetical protein